MPVQHSGHLYIQTNEIHNSVIHYLRAPDGTLSEVERCLTGRAGSASVNYRAEPIGLITEGAKSVMLTPDRRFLFAVNAGDNSISSFGVAEDGMLTLRDDKRTGAVATGKSGTAKSLAYAPSSRTLYVLHTFGPNHLRLMSVDNEGKLTARPEQYSVTPQDKPNRVPTMAVLSPDERFLRNRPGAAALLAS